VHERVIVGRDAEFARLAALLAEDRAAVVVGEAGVGKTTLLRAVCAAGGRPVAEGGALSTLAWMQYLPLERALGRPVRPGDTTAVAADVEAAVGSGVLVLDDAQWADPATLDVVEQLAGRIGILTGLRRGDPAADHVLDRLHGAGFVEVPLAPLRPDEAADVVRGLRPDLPEATVAGVVRRTGGNPLLLHELTATGEPSASLRLAIAARLRLLDEAGRETFAMLALAGRPMAEKELDETGVKSLLAADLVVRGSAGIAVRHALLAEVLTEQLPADELPALHSRLARAVHDDGEAARHLQLAGELDAASAVALRAAEATNRPGEQAAHLAIAAQCASGPQADELRLRAAHALERAHDWDEMVRVLALLDPDNREAQALACLLRARSAWTAGDAEGLRTNLDAGLALVAGTGSDVEVRLRVEQVRVPVFVEADYDRAVADGLRALELARDTGVDVPRAEYLYGTALATADLPGADAHLLSAIAHARAAGDTNTEFLARNNLISYHESSGDPAAGRALCAESIGRARELGLGEWENVFRTDKLVLDFHGGDYAQVIGAADELLDALREPRARDVVVETLCLALVDVGRIDEAVRRIEAARFADDYRGTIQSQWVRIEAALWGGRPEVALEQAEHCLTIAEKDDPNLQFFFISRAYAREDLGQDPGPAVPAHERPMLQAVRPETAGVALMHAADPGASTLFLEAAAIWAPFHRRGELRCLWAAGEAARRAGDLAGAVALLEDAEDRLQVHGMLPLLSRVHRSLRAAGVRRSAPRTRTAGDLLTGRQRELLRLVGDGLTNAQIAQRLSISRHTVVSQLSSAVTKLGATSRTHAAALAADQAEVR
jgi:DNA-binding CsgD family transcriptional regulator